MEEFIPQDRRKFLKQMSVATLAAGASLLESEHFNVQAAQSERQEQSEQAKDSGQGSNQRAIECARLRRDAAQQGLRDTPQNLQHPTNLDEQIYPDKIGSYSKGLPHNNDGTVVLNAYAALVRALDSERPVDFNAIPMGGDRRLTNPQAGLAFDIEGPDSHALVQPPAPAFASREQAAEIAENYWMALLRDVPFSQYQTNPIANDAAADLTLFGSDFKGAKSGGSVTPETLFRGVNPEDKKGPYLSQYFYQPCNFGANSIDQKIRTTTPGINYMTDFNSWLSVQRGFSQPSNVFSRLPGIGRARHAFRRWQSVCCQSFTGWLWNFRWSTYRHVAMRSLYKGTARGVVSKMVRASSAATRSPRRTGRQDSLSRCRIPRSHR